jgi:hypothetical protein
MNNNIEQPYKVTKVPIMHSSRPHTPHQTWIIIAKGLPIWGELGRPTKLKARGLAQYGGPPGRLMESDPAGRDFVRDGRSMPPALTDHSTYPGLGLIYY